MGRRGPLPKTKISEGSLRAGATLIPLPDVPVTVPPCPSGLLAATRHDWARFWHSPMARHVDLDADLAVLRRWILMSDEWHRAMRGIRQNRLVVGSKGQPVQHPLIGHLHSLETGLNRLEAEFGMGVMARLRLGLVGAQGALTMADLNRALKVDDVSADDDDAFVPA